VSEVVVATLLSELDIPRPTLTTMVAVTLAPAARLLKEHVIYVDPVHDPPIATAETSDVPGGSLSLTSTLVAVVLPLLATVMT